MLRILVFVLCFLPVSAFAMSYQFAGDADCIKLDGSTSDCRMSATFTVDESLYGQSYAPTSPFTLYVYEGDNVISATGAMFFQDVASLPNVVCITICSFVETDDAGNLLSWQFWNYWDQNEGRWTPEGSYVQTTFVDGYSLAVGTLSPVPVPPAFLLFGAALFGLGWIRRLVVGNTTRTALTV